MAMDKVTTSSAAIVARLPQASLIIRLASFKQCSCSAFDGGLNHLAIATADVALSEAKEHAFAISYTWGEFDRRDICMGHRANDPSQRFTFKLGTEWSVPELSNRLVELTSQTKKSCWIDQICVPQKDAEIRQTLAAIPTIYRTLPVIALFPGSLCKCLREAYDDLQEALVRSQHEARPSLDGTVAPGTVAYSHKTLITHLFGEACINSNGSCSWPHRIWPSQELLYCTRIRVVWADDKVAECYDISGKAAPGGENENYPSSFQRKLGDQVHLMQPSVVMEALRYKNYQFHFDTLFSLQMDPKFLDKGRMHSPLEINSLLASFLLGKELKIDLAQSDDHIEDDITRVYRTVNTCLVLAGTRRVATEPRDYVVSAWVDWPRYTIPKDFKAMSVWGLLSDALQQIQFLPSVPHLRTYIPNRCPIGLLSANTTGSTQWDEDGHVRCSTVSDSRDIYGLFEWRIFYISAADNRIPLRLVNQAKHESRPRIQSFEQWSNGQSVPTTVERLARCGKTWNLFPREADQQTQSHAYPADRKIKRTLLGCTSFSEVKHKFLELVCSTLRLDFESCRRNDIDLMFLEAQRPFYVGGAYLETDANAVHDWVGLKRTYDLDCVGLVNWQKLGGKVVAIPGQRVRRTLSISLPETEVRIYEAIPISTGSNTAQPQYAVIGVWMPLEAHQVPDDVEAYIPFIYDDGETNAWIV